MNNEEEKFRDSLKDLVGEQSYPYDASSWEVTNQALDKDAKRRRRFLFILFTGLGLGLAFLSYKLIAPKNSDANSNKGKELKTAPASAEKKTSEPAHPIKTQKPINEVQEQDHKSIAENKPQNVTTQAKAPVTTLSQVKVPATQAISQPEIATRPKEPSPIAIGPKTTPNQATPPIVPVNVGITAAIPKVVEENKEKQDQTPVTKNNIEKETSKDGKDDGAKANNTPTLTTNVAYTATPGQVPKEVQKEPAQQPDVQVNKTEDKVETTAPVVTKDTTNKVIPPLQVPDTSAKAAAQPTLQNAPPSTNYCYLELGTYYNFGWAYQNAREASSFNPYFGLSYLNKATDKVAISIGAYYTSVAGLKFDTKVIKATKVVFGEESEVTVITPVTLNYFLVPAKFQYFVSPKQAITLGYTIGYLLDVQSKVETYTEKLGQQVDKKNYRTGGYVEGFKTFNSQLALGYRRSIYKNLWINGEIVYGITDLRDNTFFDIRLNERMTGLKISLTYNLQNK